MAGTLFEAHPTESASAGGASVRRARVARVEFGGGARVDVALRGLEDLLGCDVASLEGELSVVRSARARLDGYEATVLEAIETVRGGPRREPPPAPEPESDSDRGPDRNGEREPPDPDSTPEPEPDREPDAKPVPRAPRLSRRERVLRERRARRLRLFPNVRAALEAGRISAEQADLLTEAGLDRCVVDELLRLAIRHGDTDQTRLDVTAARALRDEDDPERALQRLIAARSGSWGVRPDGSGWVHAELDPLTAALLVAEADRLEREEFQHHDKLAGLKARTPAQRRADVITRMLGLTPPRPARSSETSRNGQRPDAGAIPSTDHPDDTSTSSATANRQGSAAVKTVLHLVLRDADALARDGVVHTMDGTPIPTTAVAGLFDTAEIHAWRISTTGDLIGHATGRRHATRIQRLALAIRHGTCVWAGCDRRASSCDAHHMTQWHLTRDSRLTNLTLLCPEHHHQLHQTGGVLTPDPTRQHGWNITTTNGDGTQTTTSQWTKPPPAWHRPVGEGTRQSTGTPTTRKTSSKRQISPPPGDDPQLN